MIIIADTSPLNYLVLLGHVSVLEVLYRQVIIPPAVHDELLHVAAPASVRAWANNLPLWIEIRTPSHLPVALDSHLGAGEREAIALAYSEGTSSLLLIDEMRGRHEAERLGLAVTGILGILSEAATIGLLDLRDAIKRLRETNFKVSESLLNDFLRRH